jgi:hypothetical protein
LIHGIIRKTGHFMGYGMFSLICFRAFWIELRGVASLLPRQLRAHGLAILATFVNIPRQSRGLYVVSRSKRLGRGR